MPIETGELTAEDLTRLKENIFAVNDWAEGDNAHTAEMSNGRLVDSPAKVAVTIASTATASAVAQIVAEQSATARTNATSAIVAAESANVAAAAADAIEALLVGPIDAAILDGVGDETVTNPRARVGKIQFGAQSSNRPVSSLQTWLDIAGAEVTFTPLNTSGVFYLATLTGNLIAEIDNNSAPFKLLIRIFNVTSNATIAQTEIRRENDTPDKNDSFSTSFIVRDRAVILGGSSINFKAQIFANGSIWPSTPGDSLVTDCLLTIEEFAQ